MKILSGVFQDERMAEQLTTGTPIGLLIENMDQRSKDYSDIRDKYRPGHADYTYDAKYGLRDYRGGGRQSARETAMRVAAASNSSAANLSRPDSDKSACASRVPSLFLAASAAN